MSLQFQTVSFKGMFDGMKKMSGTLFHLWKASPFLMLKYFESIINQIFTVFTYHIFAQPSKTLHNEVALVVGYDNPLGQAFATQVVKMNGTVVLLDSNKERGEEFAKYLVTMVKDNRAYFHECELEKIESVKSAIETITKSLDITILLNCSTDHLVSTYFNIYRELFPIMRENSAKSRSRLVFIRTRNAENRNAILSLYGGINKDLNTQNVAGVSTVLAHIYPRMSEGFGRTVFKYIRPEDVAKKVLESVSKDQREVYVPGHMVYLDWWLKFAPSGITTLLDNFLFGDK